FSINGHRVHALPAKRPLAQTTVGPLVSSLPIADEEFREIVVGFTERLKSQLRQIQAAWDARRFEELESLAHWLKGAGGTVGFAEFHGPASELEQAAKEADEQAIPLAIEALEHLAARIEVPEPVVAE